MKKPNKLKALTNEVAALRGQLVEQNIYSKAKDAAFRDYVNERIGKINQAIRATNGIRRGESAQLYEGRISAAIAKI